MRRSYSVLPHSNCQSLAIRVSLILQNKPETFSPLIWNFEYTEKQYTAIKPQQANCNHNFTSMGPRVTQTTSPSKSSTTRGQEVTAVYTTVIPISRSHISLNIDHIRDFIHLLTAKFFAHCPSHSKHLVQQIGDKTLSDQNSNIKYKHRSLQHIVL
jgi:hypothetical protein